MIVKTVSFQKEQNLSIVQITTDNQNSFDYISGPSAIKQDLIRVKELSSGGSVNTLRVLNLSDKFVFLMDGDILIGAKQNRVLNTSVLLAPHTDTNIPVSCVERGRWSKISDKFYSGDYIAPSKLRAKKAFSVSESLNLGMKHESDQGEVWQDVDNYKTSFFCKSPTSNLSDVYEQKKNDFDNFVKNFQKDENANGIAVFVKDSLLSLDIFNRNDIYAEYFPRILKSSAMEAFIIKKQSKISEAEAKYKTLSFLDQFEHLAFDEHPGVGVGIEKRFNAEDITGFELVYNSHMIHLTALNLKKE